MADTKLSALTELAATPAADDELYIRDVSEAAADESKRITTANLLGSAGGEGHITILPYNYSSIGQGTWSFALDATHMLCGYWRNTPADADNISYKVYLVVGTYSLNLYGTIGGSYGITDFDIEGVQVGTMDWYNAATVKNYNVPINNISVVTAGLKTLRIRVDGKNASSSGYLVGLNQIALWRTA